MKSILLSTFVILLLGSCFNNDSLADISQNDQFLVSQIEKGHYDVIYIEPEESPPEESKQKVLKHAAKVAHDNGYRYFIIESENEVMVQQSLRRSTPPPPNLYQELIQEHHYETDSSGMGSLHSGRKVTILCYIDSPPNGAIDSCTLINCQ
jgi:hypothetical protein